MKYSFPFYFISLEQQSHRQLLHSQNLLPWHTSISPITISKYAMLYVWHSRPCLYQFLWQQIHWLCTRDLHVGPTVLTLLPLYLLGRATQLWGLWHKRPSLYLSYCTTFIFLVLLIFLLTRRMLRQKTVVVDKGKGKLVAVVESESADELLGKKIKGTASINFATFERSLLRMKPLDILSVTDNISKTYIIGDGGLGTV